MINSKDIIKLYFILNKLLYKHAVLGNQIFNIKKGKNCEKDFNLLYELSLAIDLLLDQNDCIIKDGVPYPFYGDMSSREFNQLTDYFTYKFDLDPVPFMDFPKNTTKFIESQGINLQGGDISGLPIGGGPGFYLTKNSSGQLVWNDIDFIISDFNAL